MKSIRKRILILTVAFVFALQLVGCRDVDSPSNTAESTSNEVVEEKTDDNQNSELIAEVEKIMDIIKNSALADVYEEDDFENVLHKLSNGTIDREICIHDIQAIISGYECAHTNLYTFHDDPIYINQIPMYFLRFEEGYYLMSAFEKYKDYLGMELIEVSGLSISEATERLSKLRNCETAAGKQYTIEYGLAETELNYLGMLNDEGNLDLALKDADGKRYDISVEPVDCSTEEYVYLIENGDQKPSYYKYANYEIPYRYESDSENEIMYFQYYSCQESGEDTIEKTVSKMVDEMNEYGTFHTVVFDVRFNPGGNRFLLREALVKYQDQIKDKNIVVLNSGHTYSAAMQLSEDLLDLFDHVTIYGEETGEKIKNKTEVKEYTFENLNCGLIVPTVVDSLPTLEERADDIQKGVMPDVEVLEKFSDYVNGVDTAYEKIEKDFAQ